MKSVSPVYYVLKIVGKRGLIILIHLPKTDITAVFSDILKNMV